MFSYYNAFILVCLAFAKLSLAPSIDYNKIIDALTV